MNPTLRRAMNAARYVAIGCGLSVLGQPGIARGTRARLDYRGIVLMFHHVRPATPTRLDANAGLEITPETLDRVLRGLAAQEYDLVSMDEVPERLSRPRGRRFAALTFDDGSRDLARYAAPVLTRHAAPFTIYVTTGFADGHAIAWWHVVERAVLATTSLTCETAEGVRVFRCETWVEKEHAAADLHALLWEMPEVARAEATQRLARQAGLAPRALTRELYMDWGELAGIAQVPGCTIGAHTITHPMLARLDEADAAREIALPRAIIGERLGRAPRHIAYPYGGTIACGPRESALARAAGYETGVTTTAGVVEDGDDLLRLERVSINGHFQSPTVIDALVSGVPTALERRARAYAARARAARAG